MWKVCLLTYTMAFQCALYLLYVCLFVLCHLVREGFKNPRHGNFPLGGVPAPGASTDEIFPKS